MKRVLLADDDSDLRSALGLLLETRLGVSVVGEASSMPELLHVISAACPDIVVLDWELPGAACANRVEAIRAVAPEAKVIVTSVRPEAAQIEAIRADGLINKSDPPEVILGLFRAVMNRHV